MTGIAIVSVHFYESHLDSTLKDLAGLARSLQCTRWVAVSNNPALVPRLDRFESSTWPGRVDVLSHDNSGQEFGAYEAGLAQLASEEVDWVLFANDTFGIHHAFSTTHRRRLIEALVNPYESDIPKAVGKLESLPRSYEMNGLRTHRWLTTSIFALNARALEVVDRRLFHPFMDLSITGTADEFFSGDLDPVLARHIAEWLFGPRPQSWYGAAPLGPSNADRMASKARAIVQEKYLSAVLEGGATRFIDIKPSGCRELLRQKWEERLFERRPSLRAAPDIEGGSA